MMLATFSDFAVNHWKDALEILVLAIGIYYAYLGLRGTRGLRVLTGLATLVLGLALLSQLFGLEVISWLLRSLSAIVVLALVIIFQPELRRMLAQLGSHRLFATPQQKGETVEIIASTAFELSNKHLGAIIAIERVTDIQSQIESGVILDSQFSPELVISIFHPKTPLHDGALIVRGDRIASAACILPVSQRADIDRNLGLRHRAAIGLSEESDAVVVCVSEETGKVSVCFRSKLELNFTPESLRRRLAELLLTADEEDLHTQPSGKIAVTGAGDSAVGSHQKESGGGARDLAT